MNTPNLDKAIQRAKKEIEIIERVQEELYDPLYGVMSLADWRAFKALAIIVKRDLNGQE